MNEDYLRILEESNKRIERLRAYSIYFNESVLISIYIKTEVVHTLFQENADNQFDISKLDLFHVQYTDSLLALLEKVKVQRQTDQLIISKEMEANKRFAMEQNEQDNQANANFEVERKVHTGKASIYFDSLAKQYAGEKVHADLSQIRYLISKYAATMYRLPSNAEALAEPKKVSYATISGVRFDLKILNELIENDSKARFICGYKAGEAVYELFRIFRTNSYFIWNVKKNMFYGIEPDSLKLLDISTNHADENNSESAFFQRNKELQAKLEALQKVHFDDAVLDLLIEYRKTLENIELLKQNFSFDKETSILKSMLNLNLNK